MTIKNAAEKAMHLGKQLQAVIEVGKVLDEIGDLENAKQEAERDTKQAESDRFDAQIELAETREAIVIAETDFENIKSNSKAYTDKVEIECNNMMAEARRERDRQLTAATKNCNKLVTEATQTINNLQDKRDRLLKEVTTVQMDVTNLEKQMQALKDRLGG